MIFLVLTFFIASTSCAYVPPTAHHVALLQSSWNQVKYNEADILYTIFKDNPDIQAKFPQFAGKDLDSLKDTADFATTAGRIFGFVSELVTLAIDESNLPAKKALMNELAISHKKRGVTKAQFNEFRKSFIGYLQNHVLWDDDMAAAWTQTGNNVYLIVFAAFDGHPM